MPKLFPKVVPLSGKKGEAIPGGTASPGQFQRKRESFCDPWADFSLSFISPELGPLPSRKSRRGCLDSSSSSEKLMTVTFVTSTWETDILMLMGERVGTVI